MLNTIDYICVGGYFTALAAIAVVVRARSLGAYWANDRATGTTVLTLSTVATSVGSGMVFGISAMAYTGGLVPLFLGLFNAIGILGAAALAPRLRALAETHAMYSLPDFLGAVYSRRCRLAGAAVNLLVYFFFLAGQLIALSTIVSVISGLPQPVSLAAAFVLLVTYTFIGGMRTDIIADNFQFALLVLLLLLLPVPILRDAQVVAGLRDLGSDYLTGEPLGGWSFVAGLFLFFTPVPLVMTDIWMRVYSARSAQVARKSLAFSAALILPFFLAFTLVGIAAYILFPGIDPDAATIHIIDRYMQPGVRGLVVAGLLAAVMSTADSMLLITGMTVSKDIGGALSSRFEADERRLFLAARVSSLCVAVLAILFARVVPDLVQTMVNAFSVLMVLLPAVIFGLSGTRGNEPAAFWSITAGLITTIGLLFVIPTLAFVPGVLMCFATYAIMKLVAWLRVRRILRERA